MAGEVDCGQGEIADGDLVTVVEQAVGGDGQQRSIVASGESGYAGGGGDLGQRLPVVGVAVRGEDGSQRAG